MNGAYGNCKKDYQGKGPICYITKEAAKVCSDSKDTSDLNYSRSAHRRSGNWKGYSWEACKTYKPYKP